MTSSNVLFSECIALTIPRQWKEMLVKYARVDVSTPMFASYLQTVEEVDDNSRWMFLLQNLVSSTPVLHGRNKARFSLDSVVKMREEALRWCQKLYVSNSRVMFQMNTHIFLVQVVKVWRIRVFGK